MLAPHLSVLIKDTYVGKTRIDNHGNYEKYPSKYPFYKCHQRYPGIPSKAFIKLVLDKLVS